MLSLQVLNVIVKFLEFLKRWRQLWQIIVVFNFSDKWDFIFIVNKIRIIIRLIFHLTEYVVILNVKLTMFLSRLSVFERIILADLLFTEDYLEVLGRENAKS